MSSTQNDSVTAAAAALTRAASEARRHLLTALDFLRSASRVRRVTQVYHRALFSIERRTALVCYGLVVVDAEPVAAPDPAKLDLWACDPERVAATSRVVTVCQDCSGRGEITCPDIQRKKHEGCPDCRATGRVAGVRGDKKCLRCRGTGTLGCRTCLAGFAPCLACGAKGRKAAWIEIRIEKQVRVVAESTHPLARSHTRLLHPGDFEHGPWPYLKLADERCLGLPLGWPASLQPAIDERTERIVATRLQIFGQAQLRVQYRTALGEGMLLFDERGNGPLPDSNLKPLIFRKRLIQTVAGGGLLLAAMYSWRYSSPHEWFSRFGHGGWVFLLGLFAALAAAAATFEATLPKTAMRMGRLVFPGVLVAALCAAMVLLSTIAQPSAAHAEAALLRGDLWQARLEAEALQASQRELENSAAVLDKVHLHELREAKNLKQQASVAESQWFTPGLRARAIEQVQQESAEQLEKAVRGRDVEQLRVLEEVTRTRFPELHKKAGQQLALERAQRCLQARDAECALREVKQAEEFAATAETTSPLKAGARALLHDDFAAAMRSVRTSKGLSESREALQVAIKAAHQVASLMGEASQPSEHELATKLERITSRIERAEKREQRRSTPTSVHCCDGTTSPSCLCSGSHRGCCSHHGGVCGCE